MYIGAVNVAAQGEVQLGRFRAQTAGPHHLEHSRRLLQRRFIGIAPVENAEIRDHANPAMPKVERPAIEAGSMEATKELVKLGLGVSILAPWVTQTEIEEGSLVALPLGRRKLQRHWGILHWHAKQLNLAEETFIELCQSFCAALRDFGKLN
jgi:DNA-binding transcriptional LysR family regulator